jgi:hypothetical protein
VAKKTWQEQDQEEESRAKQAVTDDAPRLALLLPVREARTLLTVAPALLLIE